MIATSTEPRPRRLTVAEVARTIPSCRIDGTVHPASVTRWILRGIRLRDGSTLRLVGTRSPGGWLVDPADLDHFLAALTADRTGQPAPVPPSVTAARKRELARVAAELDAAGF
jgi:hypothetical protein